MRRGKQAAVALTMLATPLALPNLGGSAASATADNRSGFVNEGDGGYYNWAFRGWFERTGGDEKTVNFYRP